MGPQDRRLAAIAAAAAAVLGETEYHRVRTQDVAARVRLEDSGDGRSVRGNRSAVWLYNEVRSRRVLVTLAARHAWEEYLARAATVAGAEPVQPSAHTLTQARELVASALLDAARFHRAAKFLMRQVGLGIGDIATSEKRTRAEDQPPPVWPDSAWGRVAADGFAGRFTVFADHFAPSLAAASRAACPLPEAEAMAQAQTLSDLVFRALLGDEDGPLDRIAEGLAAYWFERELVRTAGPWVHQVAAAERVAARRGQRTSEPRSAATASGYLAEALMASGTLNARAATEGRLRVGLLLELLQNPDGDHAGLGFGGIESAADVLALPDPSADSAESTSHGDPVMSVHAVEQTLKGLTSRSANPADLRELCDAASRTGLAAQHFGDLDEAVEAHWIARACVEHAGTQSDSAQLDSARADGAADSYIARAETNLSEVALDQGALTEAEQLCEQALERRRRLLDGGAATWRRYAITADLHARIAGAAGRTVRAVVEAQRTLDERSTRFSGAQNASVAAARTVLGEALIGAGHPLEARHHLELAQLAYSGRLPAYGYTAQQVRVLLARAALALDSPAAAEQALPDDDVTQWLAETVSRRLAASIRGLRAVGHSWRGHCDDAIAVLDTAMADLPRADPEHPDRLLLSLDLVRAETLRRAGDPRTAIALLTEMRAAEQRLDGGRFCPATANTLRALARCADDLGDQEAASKHYRTMRELAGPDADDPRSWMLRADLDQARRLVASSDLAAAAPLLRDLLNRRLYEHGRPALQEGHPVLASARALAERIGLNTTARIGSGRNNDDASEADDWQVD
ncbi:MAG TPA: tetratricopeptide repeat protein [Actinocrinis sp.]